MDNTIQEESGLESQESINKGEKTVNELDNLPDVDQTHEPLTEEVTLNNEILDQQEMIQPDASQLDEITLDETLAINPPENDQTGHEIEASFPNDLETTDKLPLDETHEEGNLDTSEQTADATSADETKLELTHSINESANQQDNEIKKEETEIIPQKKDIISKRKARNPKRFDDGNLIPEEIDEDQVVRSPGPPPLDPISQNLDDSNLGDQRHRPDILGTTTPDRDVTLDEDYHELEVEVKPSRDELIAKYHAVIKERDELQNVNNQLHHKLADYFRKKKSEEAQNQPLFDKSSQEQEQRYLKYLSTIEQLRKQLERERLEAEHEIEDLKEKCESKQHLVNEERLLFIRGKREAANKSISTHTGKAPSQKEIDSIIQREQQKENEVFQVRLENIKLKNQLKKRELELKAKEELGEGLHMIDFEQLKIENQTYNEKIEERNEELMKLKKKINNTVQILTHVKEKLQFVLAENEREKSNLSEYDETVKKNRDVLNKTKQSRDSLRVDNLRLKQNSGLLGNTVLLRDFEECVDKNDNIESQIDHLKRKHAELVLNSKGLKQKIAQSKPEK